MVDGGDELRLRDLALREADRSLDGAIADDRRDLGLETLRRPLHRQPRRAGVVLRDRDGREELRELLRRPGGRNCHAQLTERTTSVWLWKPLTPPVRAISP